MVDRRLPERSAAAVLFPCLFVAACGEASSEAAERSADRRRGAPARTLLRDVARDAGIDFQHDNGAAGYRYLIETMGGGVAWLDYDRDGWLDAYLVQSGPVLEALGQEATEAPLPNRLFRNLGDGTFADVTDATGLGDTGFGMGCVTGDYDGDGWPDVYVLNYGANRLYSNRGDGSFVDVTDEAGVGDDGWGVSGAFGDFDRDGDLDLYVVNYLTFSCELQAGLFKKARGKAPAYPHPDRFDGAPDVLYENLGDGTFRDASKASGIAAVRPGPGKGLGVALADVDNDGDTDIYVANDSTRNFLFENDGKGVFEEVGDLAGCSYNQNGESEASMGVDFGDGDGDGRLDLFMTHLDGETNTYYGNESIPGWIEFRDVTSRNGLARTCFLRTGFGATFLDLDSDQDLDLFVANGHVIDNIQLAFSNREHAQPDQLFLNDGAGQFEDVSASAGDYFARKLVGRGTAYGDFDRDGDLDVLLGTNGGPAVLLENTAAPAGAHWLVVRLDGGTEEVRDGQGARVVLEAGGKAQLRELWTGRGYASASAAELHFGLGPHERVQRLTVRWPSGSVQELEDLAADQVLELRAESR